MENIKSTPILIPLNQDDFWKTIRTIAQEEVSKMTRKNAQTFDFEMLRLTYKPLHKITEVCGIFHVTRPTIYVWIKFGKLKPFKVSSRFYLLWNDKQTLLNTRWYAKYYKH